ncbi:MAG: protein translocase subunit SecF [Candidatus Eremiobacteraeota bacterium]|nr:protein translocase subunit SecF [Candidatus Eremiobacteraeota bacterium]MBC5826204.1 protein translocase subunit SecF [Candidatus Eremiobacteraeota bacterium]
MFFRNLKWNIIGQRYGWFALSGAVIAAGIIALIAHHGLPLGLSFTGGSSIEVKCDQTVSETTVRQALTSARLQDPQLQLAAKPSDKFPSDRILISTQQAISDPGPVYSALEAAGIKVDRTQSHIRSVGPSLSREYLNRSLWALVIALVLQLLYIAFRFGNQLRFGIVADIALVHDVLVMVGIYAIANRKADDAFLAALLTVIGYSVMDTIVIFDRIRENGRIMTNVSYDSMVNTSLLQTMTRSVNTLLTVLITLFALYFFGGDTLKNFAFALIVGVTSGAYSSIFIASPLLVMWRHAQERKRALRHDFVLTKEAAAPVAGAAVSRPPAAQTPVAPKRAAPKPRRQAPPPPRYKRRRTLTDAPSSDGRGGLNLLTDAPEPQPDDDTVEGSSEGS